MAAIIRMDNVDVNELRTKIPDLHKYPLPEAIYKGLNLPAPSVHTFSEFLRSYQAALFHPSTEPGETRPPAEGGIREMPASEVK